MTLLECAQDALKPFGYVVVPPVENLFSVLEFDLSDSDKSDLQNTWRNDWRAELQATLENGLCVLVVQSSLHEGVAVFGAAKGPGESAQMWLLQSISFSAGAERVHGAGWALKAVEMSKSIVELFRQKFGTIFNFKDKHQTRSIKWLQMCGFEFFQRQDVCCDTWFFGIGPQILQMANDPGIWASYLGKNISSQDVTIGFKECPLKSGL